MKGKTTWVLAGAVFALWGSNLVHAADTDKAIEYRKAVFTAVGWQMQHMGAMVKGQVSYDQAKFQDYAEAMAALSHMPLDGFPKGSDMGNTEAKDAIWKNWSDFKSKLADFQKAGDALVVAAKSGDMGKIKPAFGALGKSCKSCHKAYKD